MDRAIVFGTIYAGSIPAGRASFADELSASAFSDELSASACNMWWVYIAEFGKGNLYTGITTNVQRRLTEHSNGIGAKSLRGKGPIRLVYVEGQRDQISASRREKEIKGWTREKKIELIKGFTRNPE